MIGGETDGEKPGRIFVPRCKKRESPVFLKMHTLKTKISKVLFKKKSASLFDLVVGLNSLHSLLFFFPRERKRQTKKKRDKKHASRPPRVLLESIERDERRGPTRGSLFFVSKKKERERIYFLFFL